jgi:hypothetical protein
LALDEPWLWVSALARPLGLSTPPVLLSVFCTTHPAGPFDLPGGDGSPFSINAVDHRRGRRWEETDEFGLTHAGDDILLAKNRSKDLRRRGSTPA